MPLPRRRLLAGLLAVLSIVAADASAVQAAIKRERVQLAAYIGARVDRQIGFIPVNGIERYAGSTGSKVQMGGTSYRLFWDNATFSGSTTSQALRYMKRSLRFSPSNMGLFADRALTASERRTFQVLADLGRDADVLAVAAGHPACAGLTRAQARGIATGAVTRWSQVTAPAPEQPDAISRRVPWNGVERWIEPRLGLGIKAAPGLRLERDGGLGAAAGGDRSVAVVTSWSRARAYRSTVCAVPLDGVAPTDETVRSLAYREAYPITFVMARKRPRDRLSRAVVRGYVDFVRSPAAATMFAQQGMLTMVAPG